MIITWTESNKIQRTANSYAKNYSSILKIIIAPMGNLIRAHMNVFAVIWIRMKGCTRCEEKSTNIYSS